MKVSTQAPLSVLRVNLVILFDKRIKYVKKKKLRTTELV